MTTLDEQIEAFRKGLLPTTNVRPLTEAVTFSGDVLVGKSLRLPLAVFEALTAFAEARGVAWSTLARQWIADGLAAAQAAAGQEPDPVAVIRHAMDEVGEALDRLQRAA